MNELLALQPFNLKGKTQAEIEEHGRLLNKEYLSAHNGVYAGPECRCKYCKKVFAKFIRRKDECSQ